MLQKSFTHYVDQDIVYFSPYVRLGIHRKGSVWCLALQTVDRHGQR